MKHFLCSWIVVQPHNHWGTDRTYFRVHQSRVTAPCTDWAGAEASSCWDGWTRPGAALAGAKTLCLSAVSLTLRKEGLWTDWWVAHAGCWKWIPKFSWEMDNAGFAERPLSFSEAPVSAQHRVSLLSFSRLCLPLKALPSLLPTAQRSSGLMWHHELTLTAGSQLSAPRQAFSSTGNCSWTAGPSYFSGFCLKLGQFFIFVLALVQLQRK